MRCKLSDICSYRKGKTEVKRLNNITYISTENMLPNKGGITEASSLPSIVLTQEYRKGDVLVSNIRPYFKKIWQAKYDGGCSNDVLVFTPNPMTDKDFLYYVLANDEFFLYSMATSKGTMFDPTLVKDLITKVKGKSALAALCGQTPIPFNGLKEMIFSMDNEIDIVAENGKKTEGGIAIAPVKIVPVKFEYGARISDEFMTATEEEQLDILTAFNDGFAKKVAKGLDLAAMHGINPRTGTASAVIGDNHFDAKVTQTVDYASATPDTNLEDAIAVVDGSEGDVTGLALSKTFGSAMAKVKANGIKQYPEFAFGASPATFNGIPTSVNKTVSSGTTKDHGIIGDFQGAVKWGYSKEIPMEIIQYGDPDNSGKDLKGYGQIYIRAEVYLGWGILVPEWFARIKEA